MRSMNKKAISWFVLGVGAVMLFTIGLNIGRKHKAKAKQNQVTIVETRDTVVEVNPETMEETIRIVTKLDTVLPAR
jgi:hypothetical protein